MKIGIPAGLLYYKYYPFIETFFSGLDADMVISEDTNKNILNLGIKYCTDEACLPIKLFHGHVASIKDKCDFLFVPRVMQLKKGEFICPKFCGLPEMIKNSIPDLPPLLDYPLYSYSDKLFNKWAVHTGSAVTKNIWKIKKVLKESVNAQEDSRFKYADNCEINIALVGHPYNIHDKFSNMDIINKLHDKGIGIITEDSIDDELIDNESNVLFKRPFWTFLRRSYGFASYAAENHIVQGIIYISSFSCGIDSVTIELIKDRLKDFPILVLKIDEHTGEAGFNTRIEAFCDMLERRCA